MPERKSDVSGTSNWADVQTTDTAAAEQFYGELLSWEYDVVQDPTGAVILLWQAKNTVGATIVNESGAFSWSELITPDGPKAAAFYQQIFGWGSHTHGEGASAYTEFTLDGSSLAGAMNPPMPDIPPMWSVDFSVADTDATVARRRPSGARCSWSRPTSNRVASRFSPIPRVRCST